VSLAELLRCSGTSCVVDNAWEECPKVCFAWGGDEG